MADPTQVQAAQDQAKQQQAALLQAIAEQGSRGEALYGQAAAAATAERQQALQSAVARAQGQGGPGGPGAPEALVAQLRTQAAAPGDERLADINQAQTNWNQDQASLTSANDAYMNQLSAAVPIVQSRTDSQVAQLKAQAEQAAQQRALQLQLGQLQLQQEQAALANTQQAGRNAADNAKTASVSQQKLDEQTWKEAVQAGVVNDAQGAGVTGQAFNHILGTAKQAGYPDTYEGAMAFLNAGIKQQGEGVTFDENGVRTDNGTSSDSQFFQDFPGADLGLLESFIARFYGQSDPNAPAAAPDSPPYYTGSGRVAYS